MMRFFSVLLIILLCSGLSGCLVSIEFRIEITDLSSGPSQPTSWHGLVGNSDEKNEYFEGEGDMNITVRGTSAYAEITAESGTVKVCIWNLDSGYETDCSYSNAAVQKTANVFDDPTTDSWRFLCCFLFVIFPLPILIWPPGASRGQ